MSDLFHAKIQEGGRLVIPSACRKRLGLKPGDDLVLEVKDDTLCMTSVRKAVAEVQEIVRQYIPPGLNLVSELLQDRREEAELES